MTKTKTITRWELNASDNFLNLRAKDFFVGRCRNNIFIMRIKYQNMYKRICTTCLKGDANSHLSVSMCVGAQ